MKSSENIDENASFLKRVGVNLRDCRKRQSLTQKQVAENLSMATITYVLIEEGKVGTTLKTLYKIAKVLNVSPSQLLVDKDEVLLTKKDIVTLYMQGENGLEFVYG
ncbi:MAG: helix-turn-helix domain-containing protein [Alphaproteobacteria bacterium]